MAYHLLTGATGLLGTYLLRDGLCAGRRIAVVVRPGTAESPRQRIESILARWERELGRALARPPVLEGDLTKPNLGLDRASVDWVSRNCVSVLHNAASLSFTTNPRTGEPHRSNVEGTRNVLDLCQTTGIRQFHHVSTSYVCGLRTGRVFESELDVGQELGNDYERTKVEAEKLLRGADFLDTLTVYRPAIIIGDSVTGYTTTFHGFYTPLKIGQALVKQFKPEEINGEPLLAALGLSGQEHKNFVPVDWVSRLITYLYDRPEHHGQTYHLAPARRVPVATCRKVIERTLEEYALQQRSQNQNTTMTELAEMQETFAGQMGAYQAYWRDDPEFDLTNTRRAAPHLAFCDVGFETLLRTSRYALTSNFGWPRPQPVIPSFDVNDYLAGALPTKSPNNGAGTVKVGLQVNGPGGGQWTLAVDGSHVIAVEMGLAADREALLYLNSKTFEQCIRGQLAPEEAARRGLLASETGSLTVERLLGVFSGMATRASEGEVPPAVAAGATTAEPARPMRKSATQRTPS
ncbi:MAG: SDR family oxidoreductase [Pirellulales bacterium]|nr:SDR family oxidoreductase [Pirellulales bacterium]